MIVVVPPSMASFSRSSVKSWCCCVQRPQDLSKPPKNGMLHICAPTLSLLLTLHGGEHLLKLRIREQTALHRCTCVIWLHVERLLVWLLIGHLILRRGRVVVVLLSRHRCRLLGTLERLELRLMLRLLQGLVYSGLRLKLLGLLLLELLVGLLLLLLERVGLPWLPAAGCLWRKRRGKEDQADELRLTGERDDYDAAIDAGQLHYTYGPSSFQILGQ